MHVPLLDLKLQYATIQHEIEPVLLHLMSSQSLILGKEVEKLKLLHHTLKIFLRIQMV